MRAYKRRVWLGAVMVLSLLAGACAPASILADNAKTSAASTSAPDLIIDMITWSPEIPLIEDTVTFTVTIKNQGNGQAVASHVAYYIDDTHQTSEAVEPIDPGVTVTKIFAWEAQAGSHTIKAVVDNSNEVTECDETNNTKTFAFSVLAPELIIETISWSPEDPSIDDTVTFTVTIKNQGNSRARCSHVDLHIDADFRGCQDVPRIEAGATMTKTFTWKAEAGSHTITAAADVLNQVNESDETNNVKTVTYATSAPDLIISKIKWSPTNFTEDMTVTFTVTIENQGSSKSYHSYVAYYIDDICQTSAYVNHIDPGAKASKTFTWRAEAGFHTVKAVADSNQTISESDETNNAKIVDLPGLAPDLIIQNITWSPASPLINHMVTFTVTVKNQGKSRVGYTQLCFYIDDRYRYQHSVSDVGAGATMTATFHCTAEAGSHTITAVADEENHIDESNESNNTKTAKVTFSSAPPSDLIVQDITWSPENPLIEDTVTFAVSIKNQSSVQVGPFHVDYYIDDKCQTSAPIDQLNGSATVTKTFTWTAQAGFHTFKAVADANNKVTESDETNNDKAVALLTLAPDLVIQGITWSPISPSTGDTVTFDVTIKNQGNERAGLSYLGYYVDGSSRGYHDVQEIDADATVNKTFTWTAQAGSHIIKVVADMENQILEGNELNNERILTLPAPDFIIDKITWSPEKSLIGDTVRFSIVVKNQGSGRADSSRVYFYIDDHSQAYSDFQEIDAGVTTTTTFTWIPEEGLHTFTAVVDRENYITESDEANNEKVVAFSVFPLSSANPAPKPTLLSTTGPKQEASVNLYCQSGRVTPGQDIVFNLDAVNPATNPTMTVQLILEVPSEISVSSAEFIKGDEGEYTASYSVAPGDICQTEVYMLANKEGSFDITGILAYYLAGNESPVDYQILSLPITVATAEATAEEPLTTSLSEKGSWLIWWFIVAVVLLGGIAIVYMLKFRKQPH